MSFSVRRVFDLLIRLLLLVLLFGCYPWPFFPLELLSHFRPQFLGLSLLCSAYFVRSSRWLSFAATALALFYAAEIAPYVFAPPPAVSFGGERLRVFVANIHVANTQTDEVMHLIERLDPDIVALSEVTPANLEKLSGLSARYPYTANSPPSLFSGPVFFSKCEIVRRRFHDGTSLLEAGVRIGEREIDLFYLPTPPPITVELLAMRNASFDALAELLTWSPRPKIVTGDFNATPWSPALKHFLSATALVDTRLGRGLNANWPESLSAAGIPIDHCFSSGEFQTIGLAAYSLPGSDHRGLLCELLLSR